MTATQPAPPAANDTDPFALDRMDDAALDELPFGVVCLDPEGIVLRYNLAEARLARLDRRQVVGRLFFEEIAPCTRTEEFEGRFRSLASAGAQLPPASVRFSYLFDFKFGSQTVDVEMLRAPEAERYYILIHRRSFDGPRADLPPGWAAPRQDELVSPDEELGVRRDAYEQRAVEVSVSLFAGLLRTCDRIAPSTWALFCREWGIEWGRRMVVELETACLEETEQSLHERSMSEVADRFGGHFRRQGWGELSFDFSTAARGAVQVHLRRSILADASRGLGHRRCYLIAGLVEAVFSHIAGRRLHANEVTCRCEGHARCEIIVVGAERRSALEKILQSTRDVSEVVRRLGGQGSA